LTSPSQDSQTSDSDHAQSTQPNDPNDLLKQFPAPESNPGPISLEQGEQNGEKIESKKAPENKTEEGQDSLGDDLEENPRFEALFSRLKGILKK
jgi:hypothetical protein